MKKYIGLWITAIIIFCLGISLTIAGVAGGATHIIQNSDGFLNKIGNYIESYIIEYNQSLEITDTIDDTEEIQKLNINLDGYSILLKPTKKNDISVNYKDIIGNDHPDINITTENGTMTVVGSNTDDSLNKDTVEIFIPNNLVPEINIETSNGAISVEELSLTSLTCNTTNAAISVEDVHCTATLSVTTVNALISVEEVYAAAISIKSDTGIITFDSLHFVSLDITNMTGAINGELESKQLYTVTTTHNGNTETVGTGDRAVNITNGTGIISIEYDN